MKRLKDSWRHCRWPGPVDVDVYAYCLAHRRRVRWLQAPMWWHHTDDLRTCSGMLRTFAPRKPGPWKPGDWPGTRKEVTDGEDRNREAFHGRHQAAG